MDKIPPKQRQYQYDQSEQGQWIILPPSQDRDQIVGDSKFDLTGWSKVIVCLGLFKIIHQNSFVLFLPFVSFNDA